MDAKSLNEFLEFWSGVNWDAVIGKWPTPLTLVWSDHDEPQGFIVGDWSVTYPSVEPYPASCGKPPDVFPRQAMRYWET